MTQSTAFAKIAKLEIPERTKEALRNLWKTMKPLTEEILRFVYQHRHLTDSLVLGAIAAFLLGLIPFVGDFLALAALITLPAIGLLFEIRSLLAKHFRTLSW